jgi:hypothetical protein
MMFKSLMCRFKSYWVSYSFLHTCGGWRGDFGGCYYHGMIWDDTGSQQFDWENGGLQYGVLDLSFASILPRDVHAQYKVKSPLPPPPGSDLTTCVFLGPLHQHRYGFDPCPTPLLWGSSLHFLLPSSNTALSILTTSRNPWSHVKSDATVVGFGRVRRSQGTMPLRSDVWGP